MFLVLNYFLLFLCLVLWFYLKISTRQSLWKTKGIKYIKPRFFFGCMEFRRTKSFAESVQELYNAFPEERYHGIYQFTIPILLVKDPELIKLITIKHFEHFPNHRDFGSPDLDPLWNNNLFTLRDSKWRHLRTILSPCFTTNKMKIMHELIDQCTRQFLHFYKHQNQELVEVEVKDACTRFANDVIAAAAFGINCNSLQEPNNEFYVKAKDAFNNKGLRFFRFFVNEFSPTIAKMLGIRMVPASFADFFCTAIKKSVEARQEKNVIRPDMLQLLIEAQHKERGQITIEDITAQAFTFYFAGFESVSASITLTLYELAMNPHVQERLRTEIKNVEGQLTYDSLHGLKYLDMVVLESLRKWPPFGHIHRQSVKDFVIEPERPGEGPLLLEKGTVCWLPVFGLHRDPRYYPNPDKFDPERFSEENKHKIHPSTYLPFGAGPRYCIGARFALLESKLVICHLLKSFQVVPVARTKVPLVLDKNSFSPSSEGGMWLGFKRIGGF